MDNVVFINFHQLWFFGSFAFHFFQSTTRGSPWCWWPFTASCFFLRMLNFLAFFIGNSDFFSILLAILRFFMKNSFNLLVPLTSELYLTNYRTVGYGCATSITICPYILLSLFVWDVYSSFLVFLVMGKKWPLWDRHE